MTTDAADPEGTLAAGEASPTESFLAEFHRFYPPGSEAAGFFHLTRSLVLAARRWRKLADKRIKLLGQSMARWETLFLVAFSRDDRTQRELACLISIEGPTLVRMLDVLREEGLIDRRQSEGDRRMTTNTITPEGERVVGEIKATTDALRLDVLRGIDPDELALCQRVLDKIIARLGELGDGR